MNQIFNLLIGLFIPVVGLISGIIAFSDSDFFVFGFPILYFWVFIWFVLTSVCISLSWHFFDSKKTEIE